MHDHEKSQLTLSCTHLFVAVQCTCLNLARNRIPQWSGTANKAQVLLVGHHKDFINAFFIEFVGCGASKEAPGP